MTLHATALYGGALGILFVLLSINVSRVRAKHGVLLGDGNVAEVIAAIRAHGNAAEYIPLALVLLVCVELLGGNSVSMHSLGGMLLTGRLLHAHGMLARAGTRTLGIVLTWLSILGLSAYALYLRF